MPSIVLEPEAMKAIEVAVAVIENPDGTFLIAKRPSHLHMGGYWEFPGGKIETGETVLVALRREIREELALDVQAAEPMLRIPFRYPEKQVILHVWRVTKYAGSELPLENQQLAWIAKEELLRYPFPPANRAILSALRLSERMLITGSFKTAAECLARVQQAVQEHGIRCVQFRAHHLPQDIYRQVANQLQLYATNTGTTLLLNTVDTALIGMGCGLHLSFDNLSRLTSRPVGQDTLLGASCHSIEQLVKAISLPVDYVTFSPVMCTQSHPLEEAKGWDALAEFVKSSPVPVYAQGGMTAQDLPMARQCGAHGIAAISAWWYKKN